jgi:hypothetical protein
LGKGGVREAGTKKPDGSWPQRNLVAFCADGGTCNQLAAMYKGVVRSSNPQPICGQLPGPLGDSSPVSIQQGDPKGDLPADFADFAQKAGDLGQGLIFVSRASSVIGAFAVEDSIKPNAAAALRTSAGTPRRSPRRAPPTAAKGPRRHDGRASRCKRRS